MKKIISLILSVLMLGLSVPVYAEEATPRYIHIIQVSDYFNISSNGVATVTADIATRSGAYCTIAATIKKETTSGSWSNVTTFRATGDDYAVVEETIRLAKGYTYKCVYTYTVYDDYDFIIEQETYNSQEIDYT